MFCVRRKVWYKSDTINIAYVYVSIISSWYDDLYKLVHTALNTSWYYQKEDLYSKVRFRMISNNYVGIMVLHPLLNDYGAIGVVNNI